MIINNNYPNYVAFSNGDYRVGELPLVTAFLSIPAGSGSTRALLADIENVHSIGLTSLNFHKDAKFYWELEFTPIEMPNTLKNSVVNLSKAFSTLNKNCFLNHADNIMHSANYTKVSLYRRGFNENGELDEAQFIAEEDVLFDVDYINSQLHDFLDCYMFEPAQNITC
jgi:hypothetical protein